jgi:uncharacterized membrane protein
VTTRRAEHGHAFAMTRVVVAGSLGVVAFAVAMALTVWQAAVLVGWTTTAAVMVGWILRVILPKDGPATAALATREDDSRTAADLLLICAAVGSLAAVGLGLVEGAHVHGGGQAALTVLAVLSIVLSWALIHSVFTLRYAHLFYSEGGGIDFNEKDDPDYHDFAYLAVTLGMTYQVSDTDLTTKAVRHTALRHALLSYLFGTVIIAVAINVVAGLVK